MFDCGGLQFSYKDTIISICFVLIFATTFPAIAQTSPYRYDDDLSQFQQQYDHSDFYQRLKYVPLDNLGESYASFGGDLRERVETSNVSLLGFRYRNQDVYDLHRILLHADLVVGHFRFFAQLGSELEVGRRPGSLPTDVDRGDLAQGFADYTWMFSRGRATLRAGRFEMSFDQGALVSLRDGPNVRQTWDGGWFIYRDGANHLDAFAVRPVAVQAGWFDDNHVHGQSLWGVHLDASPWRQFPVRLNAFYYGSVMPSVKFFPYSGWERTQTFGARVQFNAEELDGSLGGIVQIGQLAGHDVFAWGEHIDAGWTWRGLPWQPRFGLQGDALSGGSSRDGTLHTFNPLYPNYSFSTEATLEAPVNLIQGAFIVDAHPSSQFSLQYKWEALWRYSSRDAFYVAPIFALVRPINVIGDRYSGFEQQLRASWRLSQFWSGAFALVYFAPSKFLRDAGATAETFGMVELSFKF